MGKPGKERVSMNTLSDALSDISRCCPALMFITLVDIRPFVYILVEINEYQSARQAVGVIAGDAVCLRVRVWTRILPKM